MEALKLVEHLLPKQQGEYQCLKDAHLRGYLSVKPNYVRICMGKPKQETTVQDFKDSLTTYFENHIHMSVVQEKNNLLDPRLAI